MVAGWHIVLSRLRFPEARRKNYSDSEVLLEDSGRLLAIGVAWSPTFNPAGASGLWGENLDADRLGALDRRQRGAMEVNNEQAFVSKCVDHGRGHCGICSRSIVARDARG
jgi:hypothetical protein